MSKKHNRMNHFEEQMKSAYLKACKREEIVERIYIDPFYNVPVKVLRGFPESQLQTGRFKR